MVKKKYEELEKKYKLPSYKTVDADFEISTIECDDFLLREVRRKIVIKLDAYNKVLESILMPESNLSSLYEYQIFTDDQKKKLYLLFKKLMYFDRLSIETSVDENDKKTSSFINEFWKEWPSMKKKIHDTVKSLREGWTKDFKLKEEKTYLG